MTKLVATLSIVVPLDGDCLELSAGEEVDTSDIPAGSLKRMIDLGQLVDPEKWEEEVFVPDDSDDLTIVASISEVLVVDLGVAPQVVTALQGAGISTVADIAKHGQEFKTLTTIDGIGDSSEKAIQEAITKRQTGIEAAK